MAFIYLLWTIYHLLNKSMYLHLLTTFIDYEHLWTIHQHFLIYELSINMIQHIFINLLTIYQHVFCASTIHSCRISRRKWHTLWTAPGDQLPGLSAIYLRRLAQARAELQPGGAQGARCRTGGSWTKMGRFSWENQGLDSETGTIQQQNDVILKKTEESTVQNISRKTTSFCWGCWRSFLANWMLFFGTAWPAGYFYPGKSPILGWFGIHHVCWVPSHQISSGGRLLVPLGIRLQKEAQMLMLIMERKASGNYRGSEQNSGTGLVFILHFTYDCYCCYL